MKLDALAFHGLKEIFGFEKINLVAYTCPDLKKIDLILVILSI